MKAMGTISAGGVWFPNARFITSTGDFSSADNYRLSTATPFSSGNNTLNTREMRWEKTKTWSWSNYDGYKVWQNHGESSLDANWMVDGRVVRCQME